jgi:hypothetical protein
MTGVVSLWSQKRRLMARIVTIVATLICILCILFGFWYWAFFGISQEVGTALGVTAVLSGTIGFCSGMVDNL